MDTKVQVTEIPQRWASADGRYSVVVCAQCLSDMLDLAKEHFPEEVGTSLVGHYSSDGYTAFVGDLAPFTRDSETGKSIFRRGIEGLKAFFSNLFRQSEGKRYYVGDWHSHPRGAPVPSSRDDKTQSAVANDANCACEECILILIGGDLIDSPELGIYVYSSEDGRVDLRHE